jgi:hypothetical protein
MMRVVSVAVITALLAVWLAACTTAREQSCAMRG